MTYHLGPKSCFARGQTLGHRLALAVALTLIIGIAQRSAAQVTIPVTTIHQGVTNGECSLQEAIYSSELKLNIAVGSTDPDSFYTTGCVPGTGMGDTIVLPPGAVFTLDHFWDRDSHNAYGPTATPIIFVPITIEGNGATLQWVSALARPGNARLFTVGRVKDPGFGSGTGDLVLRSVYIKGFHIKGGDGANGGGGGGLGAGGAIFVDGFLTVENSTFENNGAVGGNGGGRGGGGGGGGGGLSGNGGEGCSLSGGGGGGSRGDGGNGTCGGIHEGGGGGGGTVFSGGNANAAGVGGSGGFLCGGNGGDFGNDGHTPKCPGAGGGGGGSNTGGIDTGDIPSDGGGAPGSYGGGGGGGSGDGGSGGFGGGGGSGGFGGLWSLFFLHGGDGGFGGGGGAAAGSTTIDNDPGKGGPFGGRADPNNGGGGGALGGAIFSQCCRTQVHNSTFFNNSVTRGVAGGGLADNGADAGGAVFSLLYSGNYKFYLQRQPKYRLRRSRYGLF